MLSRPGSGSSAVSGDTQKEVRMAVKFLSEEWAQR